MSKKGQGKCGNPRCDKQKAPDSYLCKEHANQFARLRSEMESDPWLLYNQRSDNPNRKMIDDAEKRPGAIRKRRPKTPTCCAPGCFELRVPPDPYCYAHHDFAGGGDS